MKLKLGIVLLVVGIMSSTAAPRPSAQVVRESDATSIAGSLGGGAPTSAWWTFKSGGGEILFASLDGDIYAVKSGHHEEETAAAVEAEEGGGCEDAGPSRFCLQVLDPYDVVLCESTRPAPPPGWQRDPRMACQLPASRVPATYTVRVSLATAEGECLTNPALVPPAGEARAFLLDLSLRRVPASGVTIQQAAAQSRNQY